MTENELLTKMARMIKDVINACDAFASVHVPKDTAPVCILPKGMRYKLGECLDDLRDMVEPEDCSSLRQQLQAAQAEVEGLKAQERESTIHGTEVISFRQVKRGRYEVDRHESVPVSEHQDSDYSGDYVSLPDHERILDFSDKEIASLQSQLSVAQTAAKEATTKWIPVAEQMPGEGDNILLFLNYDGGEYGIGYWNGEHWFDFAATDREGLPVPLRVPVTHWMPLPIQPLDEPVGLPEATTTKGEEVSNIDIHPETAKLVADFASALAEKLHKAEQKYGYSDNWKKTDWMDECREKLRHHLEKGDPLDVAAYCAFLWFHGEATK